MRPDSPKFLPKCRCNPVPPLFDPARRADNMAGLFFCLWWKVRYILFSDGHSAVYASSPADAEQRHQGLHTRLPERCFPGKLPFPSFNSSLLLCPPEARLKTFVASLPSMELPLLTWSLLQERELPSFLHISRVDMPYPRSIFLHKKSPLRQQKARCLTPGSPEGRHQKNLSIYP